MAEKEIWVYLLAYNLIRQAMVQAAALAKVVPRQLSFKHSLQVLQAGRSYQRQEAAPAGALELYVLIAQRQIGKRPGRIEPRAVKRRSKPYPMLTKPRKIAIEEVQQNGHPKKLK